jgi:hypothetical protein
MIKKIQVVEPTGPRLIDTTPVTVQIIDTTPLTVGPLDPAEVARALGAEPTAVQVPANLNPITRYAVRAELFRRLQSSDAHPCEEGNNRSPQISLSNQEWHTLEELAAKIAASTELSPSPGQVCGALLSLALRSVSADTTENGGAEGTAALVNELSARGTR